MQYKITFQDKISEHDLQTIQEGYASYTKGQIGEEELKELAFFLRDEENIAIDGIKKVTRTMAGCG